MTGKTLSIHRPRQGLRRLVDPGTTAGRQRVIGLVLFVAVFAGFVSINRFPKLDTVREDLQLAATASERSAEDLPVFGTQDCFQGFCIEGEGPLLQRWRDFSVAYLELVTVGMIFAFLVAGLTSALVFPDEHGGAFGRRKGVVGSLQGLTVGPAMTLCSACIVPVASSFKERGADIEATVSITQGSSTLNAPAVLMAFAVFPPVIAGSRLAVSIVAALALGPFVAWVVGGRRHKSDVSGPQPPPAETPKPWSQLIVEGIPSWLAASWRYLVRLGPIMVLAGLASALAIQFLTPATVERFLGNHLLGVLLAATVGVLINVPLMFEIPLVAGLVLLGMGAAPAAVLLFAAAAGGPITFWGLARRITWKGSVAMAGGTWVTASAAGVVVLLVGTTVPLQAASPTITFDGEECAYSGPGSLGRGTVDFIVHNRMADDGRDRTLAVYVGHLPDDLAIEQFTADVAAAPRGEFPAYYRQAGFEDFIFPATTRSASAILHEPGTYAIVCIHGGGYYVVQEFSMRQPPGWFDEFRDTFSPYVAQQTLTVGG